MAWLLFSMSPALGPADDPMVVVIDAGHGGKDPGNLGTRRYNTQEKDIALAVSLKVGNYIQEYLKDVKVVYTRKTDVFIPLKERAEIANKAKGDVFISIHCDSFRQSGVQGTTSFVLGKNHDDENRVALQENSAILLEENYEEKYQGFDPKRPESWIALNLYQNTYLNQSVLLAKGIQDQFRERVGRRDRGVKQQPLYVTSRTAMPAVLVELGFLTNPSEEDFLNSEKGQAYLASAIYRAFRDYKVAQETIMAEAQKGQKTLPQEDFAQPREESPSPSIASKPTPSQPKSKETPKAPVQFGVQLLTSARSDKLNKMPLKALKNVQLLEENGLYKYYAGPYRSYQEAEAARRNFSQGDFPDAFVIGLLSGEKIDAREARQMLR